MNGTDKKITTDYEKYGIFQILNKTFFIFIITNKFSISNIREDQQAKI